MKNKNIVITGVTGGIGSKLATEIIKLGGRVCGISRNEGKLSELQLGTGNFKHFLHDLLDVNGIKGIVKNIKEEFGPVDGFVHCAGMEITTPLHLNNYEKYDEMFKINTFSAFEFVKFLSKKGFHNDNASFVLISSLSAHEGAQGKAVYAASKGALEGFLKPAAKELLKKRIRLNIVTPGVVNTPMNERYFERLTEEQMQNLKGEYPLGIGESEYVSDSIVFLLSEKSKWITGQNIIMDGGHLINS